MPRAPRFIPAGSLVEVTSRTSGGQLLLRPCPELNERILGILGRALVLYPLELHAFAFLSNHWHALVTVADAQRLSDFLQYVNGNVAKAAQEIHDWDGNVWGRRPQTIVVADDAAAEDRYRYILAHGAKEGLVANPLDWPGVSSARALALGETLVGRWRNRTREARLARSGAVSPEEVTTTYPILLAALPSWRSLADADRQAKTRALVEEIEAEAKIRHPNPLGLAAICSQDPLERHRIVRRLAPKVHAALEYSRNLFLAARSDFINAYRDAARALAAAAADLAAGFPSGAFPPRPPLSPAMSTHARGPIPINALPACLTLGG